MDVCESSNSVNDSAGISLRGRIIAVGVFGVICAVFFLLFASGRGWVNLRPVLGACGFKVQFGLPCPGCGWTHAAQAFAAGRIPEAFYLQPAAAVFCFAAAAAAFFALHAAVFGVMSGPLRWARSPGGIKVLILTTMFVILGGWAVTLTRALIERGGM